jgi:hypothetical protein
MSESTKKFSKIYGIIDPVTNKIVYIGKANNVQARLKTHISSSRTKKSNLYSWITEQINNGRPIQMVELASAISEDWQSLEKAMISQYRAEGLLLNMANGGNSPSCSPEICKQNAVRLNERRKSDPLFQRVWEMKRAMAQGLKFLQRPGADPEKYKSIVAKLKYAAEKRPDLFGCWSGL